MKNLNHKSNLNRKVTSLVTLSSAMAIGLFATSPAFAFQSRTIQGNYLTKHSEAFLGHGNTQAKALSDALYGAKCLYGKELARSAPTYKVMYNNTWWNATVVFTCPADPRAPTL